MDVYYAYNFASAAWMCLEALPLIASPTIITTLLSPEVRESTALEEYLCRSLGFTLIAFAILNLLLTGSIPLTASLSDTASAAVSTEASNPTAPYALPSLTVSEVYHLAVTWYCYTEYQTGDSSVFLVSVLVHGLFACVGGWIVLFGSSDGRISRKTGADKRTSGFPFKNAQADKKRAGKKAA